MDKNKIINWFFWASLFLVIFFGIYRFFISRNFLLVFETECDPTVENCFVWHCDESLGECTGNEEDDVWYYSKVKKMAYDAKRCNPQKEKCPDESICDQPISQRCWIEKCSEETLGEDEECSYPEVYLKEHPEALEEQEEVSVEELGSEPVSESENEINENDAIDSGENVPSDGDSNNVVEENSSAVPEILPNYQEISPAPTAVPVSELVIPTASPNPNVVPY